MLPAPHQVHTVVKTLQAVMLKHYISSYLQVGSHFAQQCLCSHNASNLKKRERGEGEGGRERVRGWREREIQVII